MPVISHRVVQFTTRRGWARRFLISLTVSATAVAGVALVATPATAATTTIYDGSHYTRAAASCWAIKQLRADAPSGVYWLQTPSLITAQQFYCDQTTDGGGWVLVARGREGWAFANGGQGSPSAVRATITGTAAFSPAALPTSTIDGLLNGTPVSSLADGVRVRRAADTSGSTWQELRLHLAPLPDGVPSGWSWAFGGGAKLSAFSVNGVVNSGTRLTSRSVNASTSGAALTQLNTYEWSSHTYKNGFWYGSSVAGQANSTSYLWQNGSEKNAVPFAQVWLRPQITDPVYTAPPVDGAPAQPLRPLMKNTTEPSTTWGVSGVVGGGTGENNLEVQAIAPVGGTVYVGGKFEYVQRGATPTSDEKIRQPYLAAFDIATGAWKPSFLPALDGQVYDIQPLADGTLIIGGEFTSVGGAPGTRGLAKIDPATGAVVPGWSASLLDSSTPTSTRARSMDLQGNWLYVGGTFNTVTGGGVAPGTKTRTVKLRNMTRLNVATGEPDPVWRPTFNAGVVEVDASDRGDRVYIVGFFKPDANTPSFTQASGAAALSTSGTGALLPEWKQYQASTTGKQYQQIVREFGDVFWQGGSEHVWQQYDRNTFNLLKTNITKQGGDFQSATIINGVVYASSHSEHYLYSDATTWTGDPLPPVYSRVDPYKWIGAWDAQTGQYLPEFAISGLRMRGGNGPWELTSDDSGCLWFGGDVRQGSYSAALGGYQWLGGFGRVCPRDAVAPTAVTGLKAVRTSTGVNLSWGASSDDSGAVSYEILRDDRVLLTTTSLKYTDTGAPAGSTYWVRAIDTTGNRSATPAGVVG